MSKVCICIPSYRRDVLVFGHFPLPFKTFLISDPEVFEKHQEWDGVGNISVVKGQVGMSAQVAECYKVAHKNGYEWFFRLDDDMGPKTFLHKDGRYLDLEQVIRECLKCAEETKTSLIGLNNTMNRHWMHEGYGRTYGLIHGGAHLCKSSPYPEEFIDTRIQYYEDVYRSLSHRKRDGAVGRVKHIGVDKSGSTDRVIKAKDLHKADIELILKRFPGMVTCEGVKEINNGMDEIANWRYKKTPKGLSRP